MLFCFKSVFECFVEESWYHRYYFVLPSGDQVGIASLNLFQQWFRYLITFFMNFFPFFVERLVVPIWFEIFIDFLQFAFLFYQFFFQNVFIIAGTIFFFGEFQFMQGLLVWVFQVIRILATATRAFCPVCINRIVFRVVVRCNFYL